MAGRTCGTAQLLSATAKAAHNLALKPHRLHGHPPLLCSTASKERAERKRRETRHNDEKNTPKYGLLALTNEERKNHVERAKGTDTQIH